MRATAAFCPISIWTIKKALGPTAQMAKGRCQRENKNKKKKKIEIYFEQTTLFEISIEIYY